MRQPPRDSTARDLVPYRLRPLFACCVAVACSACGLGDTAPPRRPDCAREATDSAQATCLALDTVWRASGIRPQVLTAARVSQGWRVRTMPADAGVLDGMGAVIVAPPARIVEVVLGDSL